MSSSASVKSRPSGIPLHPNSRPLIALKSEVLKPEKIAAINPHQATIDEIVSACKEIFNLKETRSERGESLIKTLRTPVKKLTDLSVCLNPDLEKKILEIFQKNILPFREDHLKLARNQVLRELASQYIKELEISELSYEEKGHMNLLNFFLLK